MGDSVDHGIESGMMGGVCSKSLQLWPSSIIVTVRIV